MKRALRAIFFLVFLLVGGALLGSVVPRPFFGAEGGARTYRILVLSNRIHTDIALPLTDDLRQRFGFVHRNGLALDMQGAQYLVIGWGGRAFYTQTPTWSELKPMPLLKGLTADASAMHVALGGEFDLADPTVLAFDIDEAGYRRLVDYIRASFVEKDGEPVEIVGAGYGQFDRFYEAKGTFSALLGCNTWTARGLRNAGLRTGWWNPLPVLLRASLRLYSDPLPSGR